MKTIGIKVRNYTNEVNIINNNDIERRVLKIMLLAFGILSILYVVFLGNMIFNIVERRNLEADARTLSNQVGDLEANYLYMSDKVDLPFSYSLGFKEITPSFATRTSLGLVPKSNSNEI
ncbi:MAG: hypothetical protein KGL67_02035 [Patescibacteria group bacterium]|nr:hypothetical protein [Patescibacteria group bacterium]